MTGANFVNLSVYKVFFARGKCHFWWRKQYICSHTRTDMFVTSHCTKKFRQHVKLHDKEPSKQRLLNSNKPSRNSGTWKTARVFTAPLLCSLYFDQVISDNIHIPEIHRGKNLIKYLSCMNEGIQTPKYGG